MADRQMKASMNQRRLTLMVDATQVPVGQLKTHHALRRRLMRKSRPLPDGASSPARETLPLRVGLSESETALRGLASAGKTGGLSATLVSGKCDQPH